MGVADAVRSHYWMTLRGHAKPLRPEYTTQFRGVRILELGGPSGLFADGGLVPIYPVASAVDNLQFSPQTSWHDLDAESEVFHHGGRDLGRQHFADDPDLAFIADDTYDAVISSHVIEHFANPIRALVAWRRVVRRGGLVLIVAPHHQGTFDRNRPVTALQHLIDDYERKTPEDDLTHLEETLLLHDATRDVPQDRRKWEDERRRNHETRVIHHHVFTTTSLLTLLQHVGITVLEHETRFPHDIYVLGRFDDPPLASVPSSPSNTGPFSA